MSVEVTLSPARAPAPAPASKRESLASPPRQRRGLKPGDIVHAEEEADAQAEIKAQEGRDEEARKESTEIQNDLPRVTFPTASPTGKSASGVLAGLRQKILDDDRESSIHVLPPAAQLNLLNVPCSVIGCDEDYGLIRLEEQLVRFRKNSGDLMRPSMENRTCSSLFTVSLS